MTRCGACWEIEIRTIEQCRRTRTWIWTGPPIYVRPCTLDVPFILGTLVYSSKPADVTHLFWMLYATAGQQQQQEPEGGGGGGVDGGGGGLGVCPEAGAE